MAMSVGDDLPTTNPGRPARVYRWGKSARPSAGDLQAVLVDVVQQLGADAEVQVCTGWSGWVREVTARPAG